MIRSRRAEHRELVRSRGIQAVISEHAGQIGYRTWRSCKGGRWPTVDKGIYTGRHVVERSSPTCKRGHGIATRYGKLPRPYHY